MTKFDSFYGEEIYPITQSKFWKIILDKLNTILDNADRNFHNSTKDNFEYRKGYYDCIKLIVSMFKEPTSFIKEGVNSISPMEEVKREV